MLSISFKGDQRRFIQAMRSKGPRIIQVLTTKLTGSMLKLASYVQTKKLSGQVLNARTGNLRASVRAIPAHLEGTKLEAGVEAAGGTAFYGAFHEYGTSRPYEIRAVNGRALSFVMGGKQRFFASVIHPPIKQRAFLAPSIEENIDSIMSDLRTGVTEVVGEE